MTGARAKRCSSSGVVTFALALLLPAAAAAEEVAIDGVIHVKNGASPSQGTETLELEEFWRVGGEEGDTILGVVTQALSDMEGNIYLLDRQMSQVLVFSPEGKMIRTLSREGDGPGEVRRPSDIAFLPDGSLGILQTLPGKLVKVTLDDRPAGQIVFGGDPTEGGFTTVEDINCVGGRMVLAGIALSQGATPTQQYRTSYLASFDETGAKRAVYWEKTLLLDSANPRSRDADSYSVFPHRWALASNGDVYAAAEREKFEIHVYAPDGTLMRVIEKEFTNRKRTPKEAEIYRQLVEMQMRMMPGAVVQLAETPEAIVSIDVHHDGTIWVVDSRGIVEQPEGIMLTYEVFDPQGHYIKRVEVACDGNGQDDGLIPVSPDRMILIRGMHPAIQDIQSSAVLKTDMEVVCYRVAS
jgi:hypothetical protein